MKLGEANKRVINDFWNGIYRELKAAETLEQAAGHLTDAVYQTFEDSLVLLRLFLAVPFEKLPPFNQDFAAAVAKEMGAGEEFDANTPVLSLIGSRGKEPDWNDWKKSRAHVGIPLVSPRIVRTIPMMSQLLKDLGLGLDWLSKHDENKPRGHMGGVFLVPDAGSSVDSQGRKIIPSREFVETHGVKTVFGNGARYTIDGSDFLVMIFFTNEPLDKAVAQQFNSLMYLFKAITSDLVSQGRIYA